MIQAWTILLDATPKEMDKRLRIVLCEIEKIPRTCTATANEVVFKITKVIARVSELEIASREKQVQRSVNESFT
jgi:hypothetical protein